MWRTHDLRLPPPGSPSHSRLATPDSPPESRFPIPATWLTPQPGCDEEVLGLERAPVPPVDPRRGTSRRSGGPGNPAGVHGGKRSMSPGDRRNRGDRSHHVVAYLALNGRRTIEPGTSEMGGQVAQTGRRDRVPGTGQCSRTSSGDGSMSPGRAPAGTEIRRWDPADHADRPEKVEPPLW